MSSRYGGWLAGGVFALAMVIGSNSFAASQCGEFPDVKWWGNLSHAKVEGYVDRKHDGDWSAYVEKWERQHGKLQKVYERDSSVVIKRMNIRLSGDKLADYIEKVGHRLEVTRCLAAAGGLDKFETAAGGEKLFDQHNKKRTCD